MSFGEKLTIGFVTVGAALWAADIEAKNTEMTRETAPNLREAIQKAKKAE